MSTYNALCSTASERRFRVAVDLTGINAGADVPREWIDLTSCHPAGEVVRITAVDLRAAKRETAQLRAAFGRTHYPACVSVVVDLEAMTDQDPSNARAQMACYEAERGMLAQPESLRYVGTPAGLAGLVCDIYAADVADGVTLRPLSAATLRDFGATVQPLLAPFGTVLDTTSLELITKRDQLTRAWPA